LNIKRWLSEGYRPTPTIVEAAQVLYRTHSVKEISRSDAGAVNLRDTGACVGAVIDCARRDNRKAICFVTGVPGSGKTLAGLNISTVLADAHPDEHAVFLSGNGPLVDVLREALARDKSRSEQTPKKDAHRKVRTFIQNIHHFRDHYVGNDEVPIEKVVVFDEAQRAWTREQASHFMQRKRGQLNFDMSEPEFLVSVMDRHPDWCAIVCLVGGGQEINTGEAGISEWIDALETRFRNWQVCVSPQIALPDYGSVQRMEHFLKSPRVIPNDRLHLAVSLRSYRAEALSDFVGYVVDGKPELAKASYAKIQRNYPIFIARSLAKAKSWLRGRARGSERIGLVASSGARRLRPEGLHVKAPVDPVTWFLNGRADVRSSYYLEEVASEFTVQGLELDWAGVCWDADLYRNSQGWAFQAFKGTKWQKVTDEKQRLYLKNAYRVILTRARQGMVIFVPRGDHADPTRAPSVYDDIFQFLCSCGIPTLE